MELQFIIGRAGSGKTQLCCEQFLERTGHRADNPVLIMLVPDQATFQMEHSLAAASDGAFWRAAVYSFRRLSHRILDLAGGLPQPHIGPVGKTMVIRKILADRRDDLKLFRVVRPTTAAKISTLLSEFAAAGQDDQDLVRLAMEMNARDPSSTLTARLHDLALVAGELKTRLSGRHTDPDFLLDCASSRLASCEFLRGAHVWVDGFSGFTAGEYGLLRKLWVTACRTHIALCLDPADVARPPLPGSTFYPCHRTYLRLRAMAHADGVCQIPPRILPDRPRFAAPALAYIESCALEPSPPPFADAGGLTVTEAANRRAEVEAAARHIIGLIRDRRWQWRDVAVLVRDLDQYGDIIETVFADYGIPRFIDRRRPIVHHPLCELIRSTIEAGSGPHSSLIRWLRTGLVDIDPGIVDRLENDALAAGLDAAAWFHKDWSRLVSGRLTIDRAEMLAVRRAVFPLARFLAGTQGQVPVAEAVSGLYGMFESVGVTRRLDQWCALAEAGGEPEAAAEHRQTWDAIVGLADELAVAASDEPVSLPAFGELLAAGMAELKLGLIPPALDQVLVGTVDRSRQPPIKSLILLGFNDGAFLGRVSEDGVINDAERELLTAEFGVELGLSAREQAFGEPYLAYIALTRASDDLYLSYAVADEGGRALSMSPILQTLLPALGMVPRRVGPDAETGVAADEIVTEATAVRALLPRLRDSDFGGVWEGVREWVVTDETRRLRHSRLLASGSEDGGVERLRSDTVADLFGPEIPASATALERCAGCPFGYFAQYSLRLRRRTISRFGALERGEFLHRALAMAVPALLSATDPSPEEIGALAAQTVRELWASRPELGERATGKQTAAELEATLARTLAVVAEHSRRSAFRPAEYEWEFSGDSALRIPVQGRELVVRGRIDRLDTADMNGLTTVRSIEYKTGLDRFSPAAVLFGLSLQLPIYLDRALAAFPGAVPAGMLSLRVHDPIGWHDAPPPDDRAAVLALRALRPVGVIAADPAIVRLMDRTIDGWSDIIPVAVNRDGTVRTSTSAIDPDRIELLVRAARARAAQIMSEAVSGEVAVSPALFGGRLACAACDYRAACGRDPLLPRHRARRLEAGDNLWEMIEMLAGDHDG